MRMWGTRRGAPWAAAAMVAGAMAPLPAERASAAPSAPSSVDAIVALRTRVEHGLAARTAIRRVSLRADDSGAIRIERSAELATFAHAPDAVVKGDVLMRGDSFAGVAIVADESPGGRDFGATLSFANAAGVRRLATGVAHASRPLAAAEDGLVYVERGAAGPEPSARDAHLRVDNLEIDAVDPVTAAVRVVFTWNGYALHVAGLAGSELLVHRVGPSTSDIVGIERTTGKPRVIVAALPEARDFSIDRTRGAVVITTRDARDPALATVERVDLASGTRTRLASMRDDAITGFALPTGSVSFGAPLRVGLTGDGRLSGKTLAPFGPGYTYVTHATTADGWLALVTVPEAGRFDRVGFASSAYFDGATADAKRTLAMGNATERVDVLGFVAARVSTLR